MASPSKKRNAPWTAATTSIHRRRGSSMIVAVFTLTFLFGMLLRHARLHDPPLRSTQQKERHGSVVQFTLEEQFDGEGLDFETEMTKSTKNQFGHKSNRDKFDFTVHQPDQTFGEIDRMWQCQDNDREKGRRKKLAFVHTFKTAGSTIRAVLQAYAHHCNAGIAVVVSCSTLSLDSMRSGKWLNNRGRRSGKSCALRELETRDNQQLDGRYINTTILEQHADILAGHAPLGSDAEWKDDQGRHVPVAYFTMFRDSVDKYVSGVLFSNRAKKLMFNETVAMIKKRVTNDRKYGKYYERYSAYLISPIQMDEFAKNEVSFGHESAANLIMSNLVDNNVIIGLVERMSETLELLQYAIDSDRSLNAMFQFFGMIDQNGQTNDPVKINKSQLSTAGIVAELEKDPEFMKMFREYVKWDEKVNVFARDLHMRQYRWMKQQTLRRSSR